MCRACFSSNNPLAAIAGIDNRNEKRAAVSRVSPTNNPAMMVEPERLDPGINARHCAKPTASESTSPSCSIPRRLRLTNSAIPSSNAITTIIVAITQRFFVKVPSICFLKRRPTIPTGIEPMMMSQPIHASCERLGPLPLLRLSRLR